MSRRRFKNLPNFTKFWWDKRNPSLHIKIDEEHAIILGTNSPYKVGTIVTMSDYCWCVLDKGE